MPHSIQLPTGLMNFHDHTGQVNIQKIFMPVTYSQTIASGTDFQLYIGGEVEGQPRNYREKMFKKGIYVGHHLGRPATLRYDLDSMKIRIDSGEEKDYLKIIWCYALKYILTVRAAVSGGLHVKGVLAKYEGSKGVLFLGRGGSGKSTLTKALANFGFEVLGNTHVIVKDSHAWAVPTWVRERSGNSESYVDLPRPSGNNDSPINLMVIVEHNKNGLSQLINGNSKDVEAYFHNFVSALGTYDLKEDFYDTFDSFDESVHWLNSENNALRKLMDSVPICYLSTDIYHSAALQKTVSDLITILR